MSDPTFGISITTVDEGSKPAVAADLSVIGIVGTAPDANAGTFPLNQPVSLYSDDATKLAALGDAGTLKQAIELAHAQLGDYQAAARVVVVRVEEGDDDWETIDNIVGSSSSKTGIHALTLAPPALGVAPRLITVPGFTDQQIAGVTTLTLGTQGSNMTVAPTVVFTGGGSAPGKVLPTATAVLGTGSDAGKVTSLTLDTTGENLTGTITVSFTGGGADAGKVLPTATAVIGVLANPVCAALPQVLSNLLAHAWVTGPTTSYEEWLAWRETLASQRLVPVAIGAKIGTSATVVDAAPAIVGRQCQIDHANAGRPFHSSANRALSGIVGPDRDIAFSLVDGATEGQQILANNGGIIVRGEAGVEAAIASGGFIYIGTDNAGNDDAWRFYNVTRGRDYVHLTFLKTLRQFLGVRNLTAGTVQDIMSTMDEILSGLQNTGDILGFRLGFTRDGNPTSELRLGRVKIDVQFEEPPPLRYVGIRSARYLPALDALLDDVLSSLDVTGSAA